MRWAIVCSSYRLTGWPFINFILSAHGVWRDLNGGFCFILVFLPKKSWSNNTCMFTRSASVGRFGVLLTKILNRWHGHPSTEELLDGDLVAKYNLTYTYTSDLRLQQSYLLATACLLNWLKSHESTWKFQLRQKNHSAVLVFNDNVSDASGPDFSRKKWSSGWWYGNSVGMVYIVQKWKD